MIHICYKIKKTAWGGGNQFLSALKQMLILNNKYENSISKATQVLVNGHQNLFPIIFLKILSPNVKVYHRIDGPVKYYRDDGLHVDRYIFSFIKFFVDGIVFQSEYSKSQSLNDYRFVSNIRSTVIHNSPSGDVFYRKKHKIRTSFDKKRIVICSWSNNFKKGFKHYKWIDENLNFDEFDVVFVGNSDIEFKKILNLGVMDSTNLAKVFRNSDVLIFASEVESCSNTIVEAQSCGIPVIAYQGTGNVELVKDSGELFQYSQDIPLALDKVFSNYQHYLNRLPERSIEECGKAYLKFFDDGSDGPKSVLKRYVGPVLGLVLVSVNFIIWKLSVRLK